MNKKLKKMCVYLLCISMAFGAVGCGTDKKAEETGKQEATEQNNDNMENKVIFSGKDMEGNEVNSEDIFAGHKITMVNVWATFCSPCIRELPDLEELNGEIEADGMQVVGILSDVGYMDGNYDESILELGKNILEEKGVNYTNVMCDISDFQDQVMIDAVPTTFFVDEQGSIVGQIQVGTVSKEEYKTLAKQALEEAQK